MKSLDRLLKKASLEKVSVFSREEQSRLETEIAQSGNPEAGLLSPVDIIVFINRIQSKFRGRELFCAARKPPAGGL